MISESTRWLPPGLSDNESPHNLCVSLAEKVRKIRRANYAMTISFEIWDGSMTACHAVYASAANIQKQK